VISLAAASLEGFIATREGCGRRGGSVYKIATYVNGVPGYSPLVSARAAIALIRSARRKGEYAEAYDEDGKFVPTSKVETEAESEPRK
jgi:hypothetical protein